MDLIEAHLKHLKSRGLSANTRDDRRKLLFRLDRDLPMGLAQATVEELEAWFADGDWANNSRATYYTHVTGFFDWATNGDRPLLDYNPARSLVRPRAQAGVPKPCTDAELLLAVQRAREPWRTLIVLAAYAGLRCCELATLDRAAISVESIRVVGKGGKTRVVPTAATIWAVVEPMPEGLIGRGNSALQVSDKGNRHLRRIGLDGVTFHAFRHWFGTTTLRVCRDLRIVQELMGHASPSTTAGYTQVSSEQRQMAIAALPALFAPTSR